MKLYVMNTTIRDHEITWRWVNDNTYRYQMIRAGSQALIGGDDLDSDRVNQIVTQNEKYGMRSVRTLAREKGFIGLVYSIDTPVDFDSIGDQIERNEHEVAADAEVRREATAHAIKENVSMMTGKEVKRVEIEQVETGDVNSPNAKIDNPDVAVGTELVAEGVTPRHRGRESRRAGRAQS